MSGNGGSAAVYSLDVASEVPLESRIKTLTEKAMKQIESEKKKEQANRDASIIHRAHKEMIKDFAKVLDQVADSKVIEALTNELLETSPCDYVFHDERVEDIPLHLKALTEAKAVVKIHQDLTSIPKPLEIYSRYIHAIVIISCGTVMFGDNALMQDTYDNRLKQFLIAQLITKWLNSPVILLLVEKCYSASSTLSIKHYETIIDFLDRLAAFGCRKIIEKDRTTPLISKVVDCMVLALSSITADSFMKESAIIAASAIVIDGVTPGLLGASYKALKYGIPSLILTVRLFFGDPLASVAAVNVVVKPQYIAKCMEWSVDSMHSFVAGQVGEQFFSPQLVARSQSAIDRTVETQRLREADTRKRHAEYPNQGSSGRLVPPPPHIIEMRAHRGCDPLDRLNHAIFEQQLADVPFFNDSRWLGVAANKIINRLRLLFGTIASVPGEIKGMVTDTKASVNSVDTFFTNLKSRLQSVGDNPLTKDMEFYILQELSADNKEMLLLNIQPIKELNIDFRAVLDGFVHDKAFACGVVKKSVLDLFVAIDLLMKGPTYTAERRRPSVSPSLAEPPASDSYQDFIKDMHVPHVKGDQHDPGVLDPREPFTFSDVGAPLEHLGILTERDFVMWSRKSGEDAQSTKPGGQFKSHDWFGRSFGHWEDCIAHPDTQSLAPVNLSSQKALIKRIHDLKTAEQLSAVELMSGAEDIESQVVDSIESHDDSAEPVIGTKQGRDDSRGGKNRSCRNSAASSKRTRHRKATTKKQKSKKNKRQSRRKVRRSSSRRSRK